MSGFSPIENAFAKLRALLRNGAARTVDRLWAAIGSSLDALAHRELLRRRGSPMSGVRRAPNNKDDRWKLRRREGLGRFRLSPGRLVAATMRKTKYRSDAKRSAGTDRHKRIHEMSYFTYSGWGWLLWLGFILLMFSSAGNWNYAYRAHRKFDGAPRNDASTILNERYAAGELTRVQYLEQKTDIATA